MSVYDRVNVMLRDDDVAVLRSGYDDNNDDGHGSAEKMDLYAVGVHRLYYIWAWKMMKKFIQIFICNNVWWSSVDRSSPILQHRNSVYGYGLYHSYY